MIGGKRNQRIGEMKVYIHRSLYENEAIMKYLSPGLQEINAEFCVCDQKPSNSIRWKRKVQETSANDETQVIKLVFAFIYV